MQQDVKMFQVGVHKYIERIKSTFYRVGVWHRKDVPTVRELRLKFLYSIYYFLFMISLIAGALGSANFDELIFSVEFTLSGSVVLIKFLYIIWRKKKILQLLHSICDYCVEDDDTFAQVKDKLNILMKFVAVYLSLVCFSALCVTSVIPFLGSGKTLFLSIAFPLDWKNNEFAYWMAFSFIFTQAFILSTATLFSAITWYLMTSCGLRFQVLGQQIRTMGKLNSAERIGMATGRKISGTEEDNLYLRDLLKCIALHSQLKKLTNQLDSFLSEFFVAQLTTSALNICCSIYSLAFNRDVNTVEYVVYIIALFYSLFDIFMIMNFGNEIELTSDRLSFCLFDSDWIGRPQSTKKIVLIFGEFLMKPQQMLVLKLYPLNMETFTRILNSAYSSFNILKNFK